MSELPELHEGHNICIEALKKTGWKSKEQIAILMMYMYDKGMKDNVCGNCDKQVDEMLK